MHFSYFPSYFPPKIPLLVTFTDFPCLTVRAHHVGKNIIIKWRLNAGELSVLSLFRKIVFYCNFWIKFVNLTKKGKIVRRKA